MLRELIGLIYIFVFLLNKYTKTVIVTYFLVCLDTHTHGGYAASLYAVLQKENKVSNKDLCIVVTILICLANRTGCLPVFM